MVLGDPESGPRSVVSVRGLKVHFPLSRGGFLGGKRQPLRAVDGIDFAIQAGRTLGLVGESGSGKTTVGRAILRRVPATEGSISLDGIDITQLNGERLRRLRCRMQMVFQDPHGSLNPRMKVLESVAEPLVVHRLAGSAEEARERVEELLASTGMPPEAADRYPHTFSGGQLQRVGIARALALGPEFLVLDEPVASLDTSIQAQVVNLLMELQHELDLTYLFIAHDLSIVRNISHEVAVMYAGEVVERAPTDDLYGRPLHPYTRSLLSSVPVPDPIVERNRRRGVLIGELPDPVHPPPGCRFYSRCPLREPGRCDVDAPLLRRIEGHHWAACHFAEDLGAGPAGPSRR